MQCFQRQDGRPIPGCTGGGTVKDTWDWCYSPGPVGRATPVCQVRREHMYREAAGAVTAAV